MNGLLVFIEIRLRQFSIFFQFTKKFQWILNFCQERYQRKIYKWEQQFLQRSVDLQSYKVRRPFGSLDLCKNSHSYFAVVCHCPQMIRRACEYLWNCNHAETNNAGNSINSTTLYTKNACTRNKIHLLLSTFSFKNFKDKKDEKIFPMSFLSHFDL